MSSTFRFLLFWTVACLLLLLGSTPVTLAQTPLVVYQYNSFFGGNSTYDPYLDYLASRNLPLSMRPVNYTFYSADLPLVITSPALAQALVLLPGSATQGSPTPIPLPDVVVGLDTVEAQLTPASAFVDFTLNSGPLDPAVSDLGGIAHLHPFDFGAILLIYDASITPQFQALESTFTLESLFTSGLINSLVVEDATMDSTGEAFLLTTIGVYGDKSIGLQGIADPALGDWTHFWTRAFATNMTVSHTVGQAVMSTWSAAYDVFEAGNSSLIVSFGTDPAYNTCNGYADSIRTLVHHSASGQPWAWAMVEGMAVVNTTRNVTAAEDFVNFWFTLELQSNLWDGNYMVPTLLQAETQTEPLCYQQSPVTLPKDVNLFNAPFFANGTVQANFARWKSTWASLYNASKGTGPVTGAAARVTAHVGTVLAAVMVVAVVMLVV